MNEHLSQRSASSEQRFCAGPIRSQHLAIERGDAVACDSFRNPLSHGAEILRGFCPLFVGGVLLLAAAVKAFSLVGDSVAAHLWTKIGLIEIELVTGLVLIVGVDPRRARLGSIILFGGFLAYSVHQGFVGAQSCGCMGEINFSPWYAVAFDGVALLLLIYWQPVTKRIPAESYTGWLLWILPIAFAPLLHLVGTYKPFPRLAVQPAIVQLGRQPQNSRKAFHLSLANAHQQPVTIRRIEASCPCLQAGAAETVVAAGKEAIVELELDLSRVPAFVGPLLVEIKGRSRSGELVFAAAVQANVAPKE